MILEQMDIENATVPIDQTIQFRAYSPDLKEMSVYASKINKSVGGLDVFLDNEMNDLTLVTVNYEDITSAYPGKSIVPTGVCLTRVFSSYYPFGRENSIKGSITVKEVKEDGLVLRLTKVEVLNIYSESNDDYYILNGDLEVGYYQENSEK